MADPLGNPSLFELITSKGVTGDKKDTDRLLLESLDEVLDDLLGKLVRNAFYDHMESNYYIGRECVPKRLGDLLLILERAFGRNGRTIERTRSTTVYKALLRTLTQ